MIVAAVHRAAGKSGGGYGHGIFIRLRPAAQAFQHGNDRGDPVGFLHPEPADIAEDRTMIAGGHHGQYGHKVGNIRRGNPGGAASQQGQDFQNGPIPLGGIHVQAVKIQMAAQLVGGEKERAVAPIALHAECTGRTESFPAGMIRITAEEGNGCLGQFNIGPGFHLPGDFQDAGPLQQGKGQKQSGNILAGHTPVNGVGSGTQLPRAADGVRRGSGQGAAHPFHFLPQRGQGTLGKPALHGKDSIYAKGSRHRKQKAQSGAAFPAIQDGAFRNCFNRKNGIAGIRSDDSGAQSGKAVRRGFDVPVCLGASQQGGFIGESRADQKPVCLGF